MTAKKKIPYFKSLKDAQEYLDWLYSLPVMHLAKTIEKTKQPVIRLVVNNG